MIGGIYLWVNDVEYEDESLSFFFLIKFGAMDLFIYFK
jgi:hypothetical protein